MEDFAKAQREQEEALMIHTDTPMGAGGKLFPAPEKTSEERGGFEREMLNAEHWLL